MGQSKNDKTVLSGIIAGLLSLTFPETNGHVLMETIEEAEKFYKGEKVVKKQV